MDDDLYDGEIDSDYDGDYDDEYAEIPTCDHCGRRDYEGSPHVSVADAPNDWNEGTGCHTSCEYEYMMERALESA